MQWILQFLRGTVDACLHFERTNDRIQGFIDSNYTGDFDKRIFLIGYVFIIVGCAIKWNVILQSSIALSTAKVESIAIIEAFKEIIWFKGLFRELSKDMQITIVRVLYFS